LGADQFEIAPPGTADLVLTFRNVHNWVEGGYTLPPSFAGDQDRGRYAAIGEADNFPLN
jgi:hypothetical protein